MTTSGCSPAAVTALEKASTSSFVPWRPPASLLRRGDGGSCSDGGAGRCRHRVGVAARWSSFVVEWLVSSPRVSSDSALHGEGEPTLPSATCGPSPCSSGAAPTRWPAPSPSRGSGESLLHHIKLEGGRAGRLVRREGAAAERLWRAIQDHVVFEAEPPGDRRPDGGGDRTDKAPAGRLRLRLGALEVATVRRVRSEPGGAPVELEGRVSDLGCGLGPLRRHTARRRAPIRRALRRRAGLDRRDAGRGNAGSGETRSSRGGSASISAQEVSFGGGGLGETDPPGRQSVRENWTIATDSMTSAATASMPSSRPMGTCHPSQVIVGSSRRRARGVSRTLAKTAWRSGATA
jgi:hypothetical protein